MCVEKFSELAGKKEGWWLWGESWRDHCLLADHQAMLTTADKCVRPPPLAMQCNPPPAPADVTPANVRTLHDMLLHLTTPYHIALYHTISCHIDLCILYQLEAPYLTTSCWTSIAGAVCLFNAGADVTGLQMCTMQMCTLSCTLLESECTAMQTSNVKSKDSAT